MRALLMQCGRKSSLGTPILAGRAENVAKLGSMEADMLQVIEIAVRPGRLVPYEQRYGTVYPVEMEGNAQEAEWFRRIIAPDLSIRKV